MQLNSFGGFVLCSCLLFGAFFFFSKTSVSPHLCVSVVQKVDPLSSYSFDTDSWHGGGRVEQDTPAVSASCYQGDDVEVSKVFGV